jgi:predicted ribosome quality control (RQC) complex YloA/Tae2 family protein
LVILAGRTASDHHILTIKLARPQDVWLHVAGDSGSHVLVRHPEGVVRLPRETMQMAAALAARYSKAREGGRVAVHAATCADVSKPRGLPAGKVVLRRYTTLHAIPHRSDH